MKKAFFFQNLLQENEVLKTLLSGDELFLPEGAFGPLSQQILRMFTEIKRVQSEQTADVENIPIVSRDDFKWELLIKKN